MRLGDGSVGTSPGNTGKTIGLLLVAVVLLLVLLGGLLSVFCSVLAPDRDVAVDPGRTPGLTWVRSFYGFGPSADEQLRSPTSVAIGPNGDVYATDPSRARVMVFRADGTFRRLVHTGGGGTAHGRLARPESIDVDDGGDLYIADSIASKIIVFDADGRFAREWSTPTQARGVAVSGDSVYVLGVGTVYVYGRDGTQRTAFGERGSEPGQIDAYQGIAARGGSVYVADAHNKRLQSFDAKGNLVWTTPPASSAESTTSSVAFGWDLPQDLVLDGRGNLIVADAFRFELVTVDPQTGRVLATYGMFGSADGEFHYPTSIAYDANRDWFAVADTGNHRVQIVEIGESRGPNTATGRRVLSSPYRYLLVPALLVLVSLVVTTRVALRSTRSAAAAPVQSEGNAESAAGR